MEAVMTLTRRFIRYGLLVSASVGLSMACGGSSGGTGNDVPTIVKDPTASGDAQTGTVATQLTNPLKVFVSLNGVPQPNVDVAWATSGPGAAIGPATSTTDASGNAIAVWTLSQTAGPQTATATSIGISGSPVHFTATAKAGPEASFAIAAGNNQNGFINTTASEPLDVVARDQYNNPKSGLSVNWQVLSGSASADPASSVTDATGHALTSLQFGATPGPIQIQAVPQSGLVSPVTFSATSVNPPPPPVAITVDVGPASNPLSFKSVRNGTANPAIDTLAVGGTVTWTWLSGTHGVQSTPTGGSSFTSQVGTNTGSGTFQVQFNSAGTYTYDCSIHGAIMYGSILVK
jgi:plastocyanin